MMSRVRRRARFTSLRRASGLALVLACSLAARVQRAGAQTTPLPGSDVQVIYQRLLPQIERIPLFDHHAHPAYPDDPDVDAMAIPPSHPPLRLRDTNPELIAAAKALFAYPYSDFSPAHARWLVSKTQALRKAQGQAYFDHILDQLGIETSAANRVAMAPYLDPQRFRWVFFVDSFLFPFDNRSLTERNPDEAVFMPMQEKVLQRYMQQAGLARLPESLSDYLAFITRILEENRKRGGIAMKFEVAYFRSLHFDDPGRERAEAIYSQYRAGGVPTSEDYTAFQDFIFRYLVTEGGRLHLPVHIHTAVGAGDYFSLHNGNVLNLENVLRDPRYTTTRFVLIHGGYPYARQAIWLAAMPNVYLDSSLGELYAYPAEFTHVLRLWLETYPEKITFGTDAFPYNDALGAEVSYWLGVHSARTALAAALAQMVADGEITEAKALEYAHAYLHDTAAGLYKPDR
ncbi:MAG TPA: amidohydrolase family protein [Terriglobia bacterium]|nr:amidohydrolase family protein [Terriglobia bacterium]